MARSWDSSRLNGEFGRLQASFERASAGLAPIRELQNPCEAALIAGQRGAEMLDEQHLTKMRVILWATAVSALAALILMLL
jgi:hypothetical protein